GFGFAQRFGLLEIDVGANPVRSRFRRVPLAGLVFSKKNIAGIEADDRAVADADINVAGDRNDPAPPGRAVKVDDVRRKSGADQVSGGGMGGVEKFASACVERFKMRPAVGAGVEAVEFHAVSSR